MKKFLIYLVSILIVVAIGFTVFFVVRDEERIYISANVMYVDVNDTFTIDVTFENKKSYTTVDISSAMPNVVSYDKETGVFKAVSGGMTRLLFRTSNSKFRNLYCDVYVGDGSKSTPYYIRTAKQLASIGYEMIDGIDDAGNPTSEPKYPMEACYQLANNIDLSSYNNGYWQPIGSRGVVNNLTFTGSLDGKGHTISGLHINLNKMNAEAGNPDLKVSEEVGLFAKLGRGASVADIKFRNVTIDGKYAQGGIVAGISNGATIERIEANNVYINNDAMLSDATVGGMVGFQTVVYDEEFDFNYVPKVDRCSITNFKMGQKLAEDGISVTDGNILGDVGGLVGHNVGGTIIYSYISDAIIKPTKDVEEEGNAFNATYRIGGLVGYNTHFNNDGKIVNTNDWIGGHVKDCYVNLKIDGTADTDNKKIGLLIGEYDLQVVELENTLASLDGKKAEKTISKVYGLIYNNSYAQKFDVNHPEYVGIGNHEDQLAELGSKYVAYGLDHDQMQNSGNYVSYKKEIRSDVNTYRWPVNDVWFFRGEGINYGYPVLDYAKKAVSYGISDIGDASIIATENDFLNMDPSKEYVLIESIVIHNKSTEWKGIDDFSGKFFVAKNDDGTYPTIRFETKSSAPIFNKITSTGEVHNLHLVDSNFENLTAEYFGMIANENYGLIESVVISCTDPDKKTSSITGSMGVGAIAGYNAGIIKGTETEYCEVKNTQVTIKAGTNSMMAGSVVGYNEAGVIEGVRVELSNVEVTAQNKTETDDEGNSTIVTVNFGAAQAGGIVGYNYAGRVKDVIYFNPSTNGVKVANLVKEVMVGGIAGETSGRIIDAYVYANMSANYSYEGVDKDLVKSYAGGIAGKVSGDPIKENDIYTTHIENSGVIGGSVTGYYAGGLVGFMSVGGNPSRVLTQDVFEYFKGTGQNAVKTNDAPIDIASSYTNASVRGMYAGGLAAFISNGRVSKCYTNSSLKGVDKGSQKAGLVVFATFSYLSQNSQYAGSVVEYSYANCEFDTTGSNFALATGNFRKSSFKEFISFGPGRADGFFMKCLYNVEKTNAGEAKLPSSDDAANFVFGSTIININPKDWMVGLQNLWNKWFKTDVEFAKGLVGDYNSIVCRENDMKGTNPTAFKEKNGYSDIDWSFGDGRMPELKSCDYFTVQRSDDGVYTLTKN